MGYWLATSGLFGEFASALLVAAPTAPIEQPLPAYVELAPRTVQAGEEIRRSPDGLFYVDARVNGVPVRFLIDTGASTIVLTPGDAARAGLTLDEDDFNESAATAAGATPMARVRLAHLAAGPEESRNIDAAVAQGGLGVSLLGQSWLARLESMTIRGDSMVLQ